MKVCFVCKESKPRELFQKTPSNKDGLNGRCRPCMLQYQKAWYHSRRESEKVKKTQKSRQSRLQDPLKCAYYSKKNKAKTSGLVFELSELEFKQIMSVATCPFCDYQMDIATSDTRLARNIRTLDQIIPGEGYTKLNSISICFKCNEVKNDVSPEYLLRLGQRLQSLIEERHVKD